MTPKCLLVSLLFALPALAVAGAARPTADVIDWTSCGDGFQCANVSVPLDHNNVSDIRTVTIALTRFLGADQANRKGSVFINPGGPGGSGTQWAFTTGPALSTVLGDQYDIIGFDPRGVNLTTPYVSCFNSRLEQEAFIVQTNNFQLNLPGHLSMFSPSVQAELQAQVSHFNSDVYTVAAHCYKNTGDALAYMGTEAVVKDIDFLARKIDGDDAPINYWGISYGTVIGQYMVKILPPERLGRIIIDGIVNVDHWSTYAIEVFDRTESDFAESFRVFASSCLTAKQNCTLNSFNFTSPEELLEAIGNTVDALYAHPVPIYDLSFPTTATAADLRLALGDAMYSIGRWPLLADGLALALTGNFKPLVSLVKPWVSTSDANMPDSSLCAQQIILCDDTQPYDQSRPMPTTKEMTEAVLRKVSESPNWASNWFSHLMYCHAWDVAGLTPRRSRYDGTFELTNDTLKTPVLILSNTVDAATPLTGAIAALERLGNNGRLIQQKDGYGHCSISVVSFCTMRAIQDYMLNGTVPDKSHTLCDVDQRPFAGSEAQPILTKRADSVNDDVKAAWKELAKTLPFARIL